MRLALVVAAAAFLGAAALSPATVLPDGTYRYVMRIGGSQVGSSTVVVHRGGNEIDIDESAAVAGRSVTSTRILDARTFLTRSYHAKSAGRQFDVAIAGTQATLSGPENTDRIATQDGAPFVVSDNSAAGFATIPIAILATGARTVTLACVCAGGFAAVPATITAATVGTLTISLDNQTGTMRYDPATGVLQQFDLPAEKFSLTLQSHDAGTAMPTTVNASTPVPLQPQNYVTRDATITAEDGVKLAATLTLPNARAPFGAVLLVHGSGCIDRDETIGPNKVFAQIANHLSNAGYAVLRYDKRSCGKSGGTFAVRDRLIADARDALKFLRSQSTIDPRRIYVLGHSEGGELAPSIAIADKDLRGIILMAPPALPLEQILLQQLLRNVAASRRAAAQRADLHWLGEIKSGKLKTPEDRWLRSSFGIDPLTLIAQVPCPMLILQGTKDIQVLAADTPRLVRAARAARRDVTVVMLDGDDHLFIRLAPGVVSTGGEYFVPSYLDPRLLTAIADWLAGSPQI